MKAYGLLICLIFTLSKGFAQDLEIFNLQTSYFPKQTVTGGEEEGKIGYKEVIGQFTLPQIFNNYETILMHTVVYGHLTPETDLHLNNNLHQNSSTYQTIVYRLNLNQKLNDKWRINLSIAPSLASDFKRGISKNDLLMQTSVMLMRMKSRTFKYGFGLGLSTRFGRKLVIPVGLLHHETPKRTISIILPSSVSLMYNTPSKSFYYGVRAALNGALFNIHNTDKPEFNSVLDEAGYSRLNLGISAEVRLKGGFYLNAFTGYSVARRLEFVSATDEVVDRTPDNGTFVNLGISFYPQRVKKQPTETK